MNISDSIKKLTTGLDKPALEKSSAKTAGNVATPAAETSGDSVTLSATSVQLQSLQADLSAGEAFDAKKVEEIKAAIARGDFTVDTGKVADGLLQTVKDLIHPNKG
ncbi:MAG TPA: flagellar biosynthesis anti-sigma factor FlgM [Methylophilus sp.]